MTPIVIFNCYTLDFVFEDMQQGKLIDVVDFMSKWTNAIVKRVDKNKKIMQVIMEGDFEMEITKEAIVSEL